jgi:hypothetical protein
MFKKQRRNCVVEKPALELALSHLCKIGLKTYTNIRSVDKKTLGASQYFQLVG